MSTRGANARTDASGAITIGEIMPLPHLRIQVLAGEAGFDRPLSSAQVFDHYDPWDWLEPGDAVLTNGWILPSDAAGQVRFVEHSADAGLAGLFLGDAPQRPELTPEMLAAADRCGFPVGLVHYQTSFAEICRLVDRANQRREGKVLTSIMRIHDEIRIGLVKQRTGAELLTALGRIVESTLYMVDSETWEPLIPGTVTPAAGWKDVLGEALRERGSSVPLALALKFEGQSMLALPLPTDRAGFLFVEVSADVPPRLALLQHISAACALEIARVEAEFSRQWLAGASLLMEALQGRMDPTVFAARAHELGLVDPWVCYSMDAPSEVVDRVDRHWLVRSIPHLQTASVGGRATGLIHAADERIEELRALATAAGFRAGISEPFHGAVALGDAVRQSRWAMETLPPGSIGVRDYASDAQSFLPRTQLESRQAVDRILGPLIDYDLLHEGELVRTLETYLACDRSPKRAAELLFVHNQTVNYRIARIQQLTERSLRSTADISEFWFALRALALTGGAPSGPDVGLDPRRGSG